MTTEVPMVRVFRDVTIEIRVRYGMVSKFRMWAFMRILSLAVRFCPARVELDITRNAK